MTTSLAHPRTVVDTVHVFFCTHLDIGYTDTQARIEWKMKEHLDDALRLCREHDDFRYTIETAWTLRKWLERTDDPALRREMGDRIREGRMELCAAFATQHAPLCGPEDLSQLCYDARRLADQLGVDFVSAMQNDVPGYPWAYPQILRKSGVRYLLTGINTILGGGFPLPPTHNPFYWEGVDGSRVLTMVQDGYCHYIYKWTHFRSFMNGEDLGTIEEGVKAYLANLAEGGNPYTVVGMIANPCDNRGPLESMAMLQRMREWNASGRLPKFVASTPRAYFDDLIARHGDSFPVMRGDWDPTWAWNSVKTRGPVGSVGARLAQGRLPMAEKLHAVAAMARGARFPAPEFRGAWDALIHYDEHSAPEGPGDHRRCTRREILLANRRHYEWAMRAFNDGEMLLELGVVELARGVRTPEYDTVAVFNPSAWPRTALVRAATGGAEYESFPEHRRLESLVDLGTGEIVPCDNDTVSELGGDGRGPDALPCAAFVAKDIPPMGYRLYRAVHAQQDGEAVPRPSVVAQGSARIENDRFRVEVDSVTGAITSIFDKELGYELSASGAVGFPSIDSAAANATPVSVTSTVGRTFQRIEIRRPGSWFPETDIRVSEGAGHVEIRNVFDRTAWRTQNPDAPTWSVDTRFALALPADARVTASGPNGFRRDRGDALPFIEERSLPSCSFIATDDGERCVVIASPTDYLFSAPLRGEGGIVLRTHTIAQGFGPIGLRQVAPQMMPSLEPGEEGIVVHRYAVTSHAGPFDPVRAQRLGAEFRAEMPAVFAPAAHAAPERPYPMPPEQGPPTRSFVRLDDPAGEACADVAVLRRSLFASGNFFVMRLQELAGSEARTVRVRFDPCLQVTGAAMADMVERRGDKLPLDPDGGISVRLEPFETVTLALDTAVPPRA